jgi:hypothetical protein
MDEQSVQASIVYSFSALARNGFHAAEHRSISKEKDIYDEERELRLPFSLSFKSWKRIPRF